jgi:hypothetical protein
MPRSPRLAVLRVALPTTALAGGMLLAACGSNAPATNAANRAAANQANDTLCVSPGTVTGLQIMERSPQNGTQGPAAQPSATVSVPTAAQARSMARTICELPPIPGPQQRCRTTAQGAVFLLTFSTKLGALPVVRIQESGCSQVTGAGPVRSALAKPTLAQGLHAVVHNEPPVIVGN